MAVLADTLLSLVKPAIGRAMVALGVSVVSFTGVNAAFATLRDRVISELSANSQETLQIIGLFGVWDALGLVLGACSFALSYWAATQAIRFTGAGS